jgi:hypothetical protein
MMGMVLPLRDWRVGGDGFSTINPLILVHPFDIHKLAAPSIPIPQGRVFDKGVQVKMQPSEAFGIAPCI